jgi:hypothetical protein
MSSEEQAHADLAAEEAELEAKLEMVRLERELVEAKATEAGATRALKHRVREARRAYRELRQPGEGMALPDPIRGSMTVKGA